MVILAALLLFLIWFFYMFIKFMNPYRLVYVIGKKGAGKTTLLTKLCLDNVRKGRNVYSTVKLPYARVLRIEDIGRRRFPKRSVLLIDEVGMIWDNRDFKNFSPAVRDFFKSQRHNMLTVYMFSQDTDVDKKIRKLVDKMYLLSNPFNFCPLLRTISRTITVTDAKNTGQSDLVDQLHISGFGGLFIGSTRFIYIPKYTKYFDSFERLEAEQEIVDTPFWYADSLDCSPALRRFGLRSLFSGAKDKASP